MYTVQTAAFAAAQKVDETASRGTNLLGFRVVPILQDGQTFAEAMAGLLFTYFFNGAWAQGLAGASAQFQGTTEIEVTDSSTQKLVNASNLYITGGPAGQQYLITIMEFPEELILPDDAGAAASSGGGGGGNNPSLVTISSIGPLATGYIPTGATGFSASACKGLLLSFSAPGGTFVGGQPILAYMSSDGGDTWIRVPDADLTVPGGANGLFVFGEPGLQFYVGGPLDRWIWVPAASAVNVGTTFDGVYESQA